MRRFIATSALCTLAAGISGAAFADAPPVPAAPTAPEGSVSAAESEAAVFPLARMSHRPPGESVVAQASAGRADVWPPQAGQRPVEDDGPSIGAQAVADRRSEPGGGETIGLELGGDFFTRFETRRNYASPGATIPAEDFFRYRAMMALRTTKLEISPDFHLQATLAPQAGGFLGVGGDDLVDAALGLHQGYIALFAPGFRLDAGRFEMTYGDELVIGTVGWHHLGRAFDGIRAHGEFSEKGPWLDVFATVLTEGFMAAPQAGDDFGRGDTWFLGAYAGLGPLLGEAFNLDFYVFARLVPEYAENGLEADATNEITIGARHTGLVADKLIDYRVEGGVQLGKRGPAMIQTPAAAGAAFAPAAPDNVDVLAFQGDGEIGFGFLDNRAFRVGLEGFFASGNDGTTADKDEGWNQLFPTAHKWLGVMDFIGGRTNIAGGALHLAYSPLPVLKIGLDGHIFLRPQEAKNAAGAVTTPDGYQGTELDLGILWKPGKIFGLRVGYDLFLPDDKVSPDLLHFAEVEIRAKF